MKPLRVVLCALMVGAGIGRPLAAQGTTIVGLQGGATVSSLSNWDAGVFTDGRWGGTAGVFIGRALSSAAQVNLEGNWVQMGAPGVRVDYIDIPLTVGGGIVGNTGGVNVRGYAGASIGFKVACSSNADVACTSAKSSQWTLPAGLVFGKWLDNGVFVGLDIRFLWGLSDMFEGVDANSRSLQFRLVLGKQAGGR